MDRDPSPRFFQLRYGIEHFHCFYAGHLCRQTQVQRSEKVWEPLQIKQLRWRAGECQDMEERMRLLRLAWEGKKHWLATLRQIRAAAGFARGKPAWKSKKLLPLTAMTDTSSCTTHCHETWADLAQGEFRSLWSCDDTKLRPVINDYLASRSDFGIVITTL